MKFNILILLLSITLLFSIQKTRSADEITTKLKKEQSLFTFFQIENQLIDYLVYFPVETKGVVEYVLFTNSYKGLLKVSLDKLFSVTSELDILLDEYRKDNFSKGSKQESKLKEIFGKNQKFDIFRTLAYIVISHLEEIVNMNDVQIITAFPIFSKITPLPMIVAQINSFKLYLEEIVGFLHNQKVVIYLYPEEKQEKKTRGKNKIEISNRSKLDQIIKAKRASHNSKMLLERLESYRNILKEHSDNPQVQEYIIFFYNSRMKHMIRETSFVMQTFLNPASQVVTFSINNHPDWIKLKEHIQFFTNKILTGEFKLLDSDDPIQKIKESFRKGIVMLRLISNFQEIISGRYEIIYSELLSILDEGAEVVTPKKMNELFKRGHAKFWKEDGIWNLKNILKIELTEPLIGIKDILIPKTTGGSSFFKLEDFLKCVIVDEKKGIIVEITEEDKRADEQAKEIKAKELENKTDLNRTDELKELEVNLLESNLEEKKININREDKYEEELLISIRDNLQGINFIFIRGTGVKRRE